MCGHSLCKWQEWGSLSTVKIIGYLRYGDLLTSSPWFLLFWPQVWLAMLSEEKKSCDECVVILSVVVQKGVNLVHKVRMWPLSQRCFILLVLWFLCREPSRSLQLSTCHSNFYYITSSSLTYPLFFIPCGYLFIIPLIVLSFLQEVFWECSLFLGTVW